MANESIPAPYMSFGVFKSTCEQLADSTVPTGPMDRRVLDWLSGADYGALMSGLRFLGLIDDEKKATQSFRELVTSVAEPSKFKSVLLSIVTAKYQPVVGNLDLLGGTSAQLEKAFKDYGVPAGQMLSKATRFYIKVLQDCGVEVSQHITKPKPRAARSVRPKTPNPKPRNDAPPPGDTPPHVETPSGFERLPIPGITNAFIQYPVTLTVGQVQVFEAMITALRAYAATHAAGGKGNKP